MKPLFRIEWPEIRCIAVEGPDQVAERVTATRIVAGGLFAWAFKKKQKLGYLVISTGQYEVFFEVRLTPIELRANLSPVIQALPGQSGPVSEPPPEARVA